MTSPNKAEKSIYHHIARGSALALLLRWSMRALGGVSMVVLARLLQPEDFGLIAMATLAVGLIDVFASIGVDLYVIRERDGDRDLYDSAYTIKIISGLIVGALLVIAAPAIAEYFNDTRIVHLIYVAAFAYVLDNAQNIGTALAVKELNFELDFKFNLYARLVAFFATIALAVWLRNYWALILGQLLNSVARLALSFVMFSYRPRLSLARSGAILKFGAAVMPTAVARFILAKVDVLLISNVYDASRVGSYTVGKEFAFFIVNEIVMSVNRALLPSYARLGGDAAELRRAFLVTLNATAILFCAFGVGLYAVAESFVLVVLGDRWLDSIEVLKWLALCAVAGSILYQLGGNILLVMKREWLVMALNWLRLAVTATAVLFAIEHGGVEMIPKTLLVGLVALLPCYGYIVCRVVGVTSGDLVKCVYPSLVSAAMMGVVASSMSSALPGSFLGLLSAVPTGALVYVTSIILLWFLRGRPEGPEQMVWQSVAERVKKAGRAQI